MSEPEKPEVPPLTDEQRAAHDDEILEYVRTRDGMAEAIHNVEASGKELLRMCGGDGWLPDFDVPPEWRDIVLFVRKYRKAEQRRARVMGEIVTTALHHRYV